jgi:hypothetical protein
VSAIRTKRGVHCSHGVLGRAQEWLRLGIAVGVSSLVGCTSNVSQADARAALRPLRSVPLAAAKATGRINFTERIPDSPQWRRIRAAWGSPSFVIAVVSPDQHTLPCFDKFRLNVELRANSKGIHSEPAEWLYGYSTECPNVGVRFHAEAGDLLDVAIGVPAAVIAQPDELILIADWGTKTKDRLVGVGIDEDIWSIVKRIL